MSEMLDALDWAMERGKPLPPCESCGHLIHRESSAIMQKPICRECFGRLGGNKKTD